VAAVCDFDYIQQAPKAFDKAYFLYRAAGRPSRSGGGVARIDREISQTFLEGYRSDPLNSSLPVSHEEIGHEFLHFAWFNCLLIANNTRDPKKLEEWASDTMALKGDVEQWTRESTR
jgi:hypothetical protein